MSGIVALFERTGGGADRDRLERMLDAIDHRGPDGRGAWCDDAVALGHQQLRMTPESEFDDQPYREDGLVVVSDARLDNRDELLGTLDVPDPGHPIPDSRLLLAAYREWGEACVDHLIGAFAFAIWDADDGSVFCARDHLGVKPLYYHESDDAFAVATEPKALLTLPSVSRTVDETKIGDFLVGRLGDKTNTYYDAVHRLPPAHVTAIGREGWRTWRYWDLDPTRTVDLGSDAAYERRFRELFDQAVECRLRTANPVGATLSGGLDSSSVTAMARDLLPSDQTLHTFSWTFDEAPASDEREYISALAERGGISPHYLLLDDVSVLVDETEAFSYLDEPPFNAMHYAWWETSKRAADIDIGVLLDGALGDSAVSYGLGLLPELLRTGRWWQLSTELRQLSEEWGVSQRRLFAYQALKPLVPERMVRAYQSYRERPVLEAAVNPTLDPEFVDRIGLRSRYQSLYEDDALFGQSARQQQYRSLSMGLTTANLEMIDARHAWFGVEPRHPFADKRLVEFSLAMPAEQQLSDGRTRSIVRRSLSDLLPEKIRNRVWKTSVSEGFWRALASEDHRLEALLDDPGPIANYLDMDRLEAVYGRFEPDEEVDPNEARALWRALSLSSWLEHHATDLPR